MDGRARTRLVALAAFLATGCGGHDGRTAAEDALGDGSARGAEGALAPEDVHAAFLEKLAAHCGEAFPGRVIHAPEDDPNFAFSGTTTTAEATGAWCGT